MRRRTLPNLFTSGFYISASFVAFAAVLTNSVPSQADRTCTASDYEPIGKNGVLRLKRGSLCQTDLRQENSIRAQLQAPKPATPQAAPGRSAPPAPKPRNPRAAKPTAPAAAAAPAAAVKPQAVKPTAHSDSVDEAAPPAAVPAAPAASSTAAQASTPQDEGWTGAARERGCQALKERVSSAGKELSKACKGLGDLDKCMAEADACTSGDQAKKREFEIDREDGEYRLLGMLGDGIAKDSVQCNFLAKNTCSLLMAEDASHNRDVADKALKRREDLEDQVQKLHDDIEKKTEDLTRKTEEAQRDLENIDQQISSLDDSWLKVLDDAKVANSTALYQASKDISAADSAQYARQQNLRIKNSEISQAQFSLRQKCADEKDTFLKAKRASVAKAKSGLNGISSGTKRINDSANYKYRDCMNRGQSTTIQTMQEMLNVAQDENKMFSEKEQQAKTDYMSKIKNDQELANQRMQNAFTKYQKDTEKLKTKQTQAQQKLIQAQMQMQPGGPVTVLQQKLEQKSRELEEAKKNETLAEGRAQCGEKEHSKLRGRKDDQSVSDIPESYDNLYQACLDLIAEPICNAVVVKDGKSVSDSKASGQQVEVTGRCAFFSKSAEFQAQLKSRYGNGKSAPNVGGSTAAGRKR